MEKLLTVSHYASSMQHTLQRLFPFHPTEAVKDLLLHPQQIWLELEWSSVNGLIYSRKPYSWSEVKVLHSLAVLNTWGSLQATAIPSRPLALCAREQTAYTPANTHSLYKACNIDNHSCANLQIYHMKTPFFCSFIIYLTPIENFSWPLCCVYVSWWTNWN